MTAETFDCEICRASCIRDTGSRVVTEDRCFEHASEAEQNRRRQTQGTFDLERAA